MLFLFLILHHYMDMTFEPASAAELSASSNPPEQLTRINSLEKVARFGDTLSIVERRRRWYNEMAVCRLQMLQRNERIFLQQD